MGGMVTTPTIQYPSPKEKPTPKTTPQTDTPRFSEFNADGAGRGKSGPASIGGALCNFDGQILLIKDSNEAQIVVIL